eukprot:COSAG02_NODE_1145_length_14241_cov_3.363951_2_plen_2907_part_00
MLTQAAKGDSKVPLNRLISSLSDSTVGTTLDPHTRGMTTRDEYTLRQSSIQLQIEEVLDEQSLQCRACVESIGGSASFWQTFTAGNVSAACPTLVSGCISTYENCSTALWYVLHPDSLANAPEDFELGLEEHGVPDDVAMVDVALMLDSLETIGNCYFDYTLALHFAACLEPADSPACTSKGTLQHVVETFERRPAQVILYPQNSMAESMASRRKSNRFSTCGISDEPYRRTPCKPYLYHHAACYSTGLTLTDAGIVDFEFTSDEGGANTVSSPRYRDGRTCLWQLSCSNPAARVEITFEQFRIYSGYTRHDYVVLYDGPTTGATKIETGAGADGLRGWPTMCTGTASDPASDCGQTWFQSGSCPDGCSYQQGSASEGYGGWKFDDVFSTARTAATPNILPLGPFSSSGPDMLVQFVSDNDGHQDRGFLASFQCIGADPLDDAPKRPHYRETSGLSGYSVPTQIEGYQRYDGVICSTESFVLTPIESLEEAITACNLAGAECKGLQDLHCDGREFTFCQPESQFLALDFYSSFPGGDNADRACVFEKPLWQNTEPQMIPPVPTLANRTVRVTASDRMGNAESCDVTVVIAAPRIRLSLQAINMSSLVSSSKSSVLVISNAGTDILELQTGSARGGMLLLDSEGVPANMQWAEVSWNSRLGPVRCASIENAYIRIEPGASETFVIRFVGPAAPHDGTFSGLLVISSNDPANRETRLPLLFEVHDYGLIMIALPEKTSATVAPGETFEDAISLYNVYSGALSWGVEISSGECQCSPGLANESFQCRIVASTEENGANVGIELQGCGGMLRPAGSERVRLRVTAPTQAGFHMRSWKIEPVSGSSRSFLSASVDVLVVASIDGFNATATTFTLDQSYPQPPVASRKYRLLASVFDSYGNELHVDGLQGWTVAIVVGNITTSTSIVFDYTFRENGDQGRYATEELIAAAQGLHTTVGIEGPGGVGHVLLWPTSFSVVSLQCDPPQVVPSADGALCINKWCEVGHQPSIDGRDCRLCPQGKFSDDGTVCATCPTGKISNDFGATSCHVCDAMSVPNVDRTYCLLCPRGTSASADQSVCECSPGYYNLSGDCSECSVGSFTNQSGQEICSLCPAGYTTRGRAAVGCVPCAAGTFSTVFHNINNLPCEGCPAGQYTSVGGSEACTSCAEGRFLGATGSTSVEDCVLCRKGTIDHDRDPSTICEACPVGQSTREDQVAVGATQCMCLPGWYGVKQRNPMGEWKYTCAESPGTAYADCRESFDVEHIGHQWLRQQSALSTNEDKYDEYSTSSAISAAPVLDNPINETQYAHLRVLMSGMQPPETAFCVTKSDMWFHADQSADLVRSSTELNEQPAFVCGRHRYPRPCQLEVCEPLQFYHEEKNKEDIMVAAQKMQTMLMYEWMVTGRSCFADGVDTFTVGVPQESELTHPDGLNRSLRSAAQLGLTRLSAVHDRLYQLREDAYLEGDPYRDDILPLYDVRSLLLLQPPLQSADKELCILNVCREGHEGNLCSTCKAGYSKQLSSGKCYKCQGTDYTLWWRPPLLYFVLSWKMLKKAYTPHRLKSSKMASFIFFFQTAGLVSSGTSWFGQKHNINPQLLQYVTMVRQYANLEFDRTERCTMDVYSRFYYDIFYIPLCVVIGLYVAFGCWAALIKFENRFDVLGRFWSAMYRASYGTCGKQYTPRLADDKLQFHRYQAIRARWLVYLLLYAPMTRKCASTFFCRDDIEKGGSYMKADLSVSCETVEYKLMFSVAVIMFGLIGFLVPFLVLWRLSISPNHWKHYDVESAPLQVNDYVAYRSPRVMYSSLRMSIIVDIEATLSDIHDRDHFEEHVCTAVADMFGLNVARIRVNGLKEKKCDDAGHFKKGVLKFLDESDDPHVWRDYSAWLGNDSTLSFHITDTSTQGPIVTQNIEMVSVFVWSGTVDIDGNEQSVDQGYVFEATTADGKSYKFCSLSDTTRQSWIESIQEHTSVHVVLNQRAPEQRQPLRPRRVTWKDTAQVHGHDGLQRDYSQPWLSVYLSISSDDPKEQSPAEELMNSDKSIDESAVKRLKIEGHKVLKIVLNNTAPVLGPVPLRRVTTMLRDGRLSWTTRLRAASSSEWITATGEDGQKVSTVDDLLRISRAVRNAPPVNLLEVNATTLTKELRWLLAEQFAINATEWFRQHGISSLHEDDPKQIKSALRDLCFCDFARVISVANDAECFEVEVSRSDICGGSTTAVHWYTAYTLQNTTIPHEALLKQASGRGVPDAQLQAMGAQELRDVCTRAGLSDFELSSAVDINSATEHELQMALDDEALATAIFDAAEVCEIQNESDLRLHIPFLNQQHSTALATAGFVYPTCTNASSRPGLSGANTRGQRLKDLGEITIEDREFDRRINFDPLSCFYGYAKQGHSYWFLVELLRKMVINLVYLRGTSSCDYFPWQECLIVFLIFYTLFHNYESPYRERLGNFLDTFSTMFIVMVLHAATPPATDRSNDKEIYLSNNVRFWFVVVLATLMIILGALIRFQGRVHRKEKKKAIQTASKEWAKFRGGLQLIKQHHTTSNSSQVPNNRAAAEWSLAKRILRQADTVRLLRTRQNAALNAAMFGNSDMHHHLRHGSVPAFLQGEWEVEIRQLAAHSESAAHVIRPGNTTGVQHYIMTLNAVDTRSTSSAGVHRVEGLLACNNAGVGQTDKQVKDGILQSEALVSGSYSEDRLTLLLQWVCPASLSARNDDVLTSACDRKTARNRKLTAGSLDKVVGCAIIDAVFGHREKNVRVGDHVVLSSYASKSTSKAQGRNSERGCLHGRDVGQVIKVSSVRNSTEALVIPLAATCADTDTAGSVNGTWYDALMLQHAENWIEIIGDGHAAEWDVLGPQRPLRFYAHRKSKNQFFEVAPGSTTVADASQDPLREVKTNPTDPKVPPVPLVLPPLPSLPEELRP